MIWGAISYRGVVNFIQCTGTIDSEYYCTILEDALIPDANRLFPEGWDFMQDGASPHRSNHTKELLEANDIPVIEWPAKSPDLNPIENVWSVIARSLYGNNKFYADINQLEQAVEKAFNEVSDAYLRTLYESMPKRLADVISRDGKIIDY